MLQRSGPHPLLVRAALVAAALALALASVHAAGQAPTTRTAAPAVLPLPALSMTCPMHPDVVESRPGTCPLCKMNLVPVRLDASWMCPVHAVVTESEAGSCRLCGRSLVPVVVALTWTCRGEVNAEFLEPGVCRDGTPRVGKRTLRPHGNHNPQHGGQFFMAADTWHHLEGTLPRPRLFRLHIYDDYARVLASKDLAAVRGRVVTRETVDATTRTATELATAPLRLSKDGRSLEATIPASSWPATMAVKVRFKPDQPEYRFDFTFPAVTREPAAPRAARLVTVPAPRSTPAPAASEPAASAPALPTTMSGLLDELRLRRTEIGDLVARGDFGAVWVPAFQAKDLAVALEPHVGHLEPDARSAADPALVDVVRTAWLLDAVGDGGNRQAVAQAFTAFDAAVTRLLAAFAPDPR